MKVIRILILVILMTGTLFAVERIVPCWAANEDEKIHFFDRLGDLLLISQKKELYIKKLDALKGRKITSTPEIEEVDAFFGYGGRYVIYKTEGKKSAFDRKPSYKYKYYMQPIDANDLKKEEIDEFIYRDFKKKRLLEKKKLD